MLGEIDRYLTAALSGRPLALPPAPRDGQALLHAARWHGVTGYLLAAARRPGALTPDAALGVRQAATHALWGHLRALADLQVVASALDDVAPWVVVKGPALTEIAHGAPHLRSYNDLDVVVPAQGFGASLAALERSGAQPITTDWDDLRRRGRAAVVLLGVHGTPLDLHWHILPSAARRAAFTLRLDVLLERRQPAVLGGVDAWVLDPADRVLHVALHAAMGGAHRLIWLKDLERELAAVPPNWSILGQRAESWGAAAAVAIVLERAMRLLDAPGSPAGHLRSGVWGRVVRASEVVSRDQPERRRRSISRRLMSATRRDGVLSLAQVLQDHRPRLPRARMMPVRGAERSGQSVAVSNHARAKADYVEWVAGSGT